MSPQTQTAPSSGDKDTFGVGRSAMTRTKVPPAISSFRTDLTIALMGMNERPFRLDDVDLVQLFDAGNPEVWFDRARSTFSAFCRRFCALFVPL